MFETEVVPSDPAWLQDHLVFGRVVAPGGMYGAMAVAALTYEKDPDGRDEAARGGRGADLQPAGLSG